LLRQLVFSSQVATNIADSVRSGDLIPEEALAPILEEHVNREREKGKATVLLDGFPRRLDQAAPIETLVRSQSMASTSADDAN
jgi:UMP-CMP kinase